MTTSMSRPGSAMSTSTTNSGLVVTKRATPVRKSRPVSIAVTGVSKDGEFKVLFSFHFVIISYIFRKTPSSSTQRHKIVHKANAKCHREDSNRLSIWNPQGPAQQRESHAEIIKHSIDSLAIGRTAALDHPTSRYRRKGSHRRWRD